MDQAVKSTEIDLAEKEALEINRPLLRSWWAERVMGIALIALVFAVLAEATVIVWMLPLKEIKHSLVTGYNKDTQVIKVEPIEKTTLGWNKLMEIYAKQFVVDLHTIDGQTEGIRLKKLSLMTNFKTQEYVEKQLNTSIQDCVAKKIFEAGVTRSISIKRVTSFSPDAPNIWQVDWEVNEYDLKNEVQRNHSFISTLTAETSEKVGSGEAEELNPIGYTVIEYSLRMQP